MMFDKTAVLNYLLETYSTSDNNIKNEYIGDAIKEIRKNKQIAKGYTSDEIKKFIDSTLYKTSLKNGNSLIPQIISDLYEIKKIIKNSLGEWNLIIPIENLELKLKSLSVGNIVFFNFNKYQRNKYKSYMKKLLSNNKLYNDDWKREYVRFYDEKILSNLSGKVCAKITLTGNINKIEHIANDEVETAISILKLYYDGNYDNQRKYFNVNDKIISRKNKTVIQYKNDGSFINPTLLKVGYFFEFNIDKNRVQYMKKNQFNIIHKMFKKDKLTKLEERILNSIRLFGSAMNVMLTKTKIKNPIGYGFKSDSDEHITIFESLLMNERLIKLFISLESLLIFDDNEPLSNNIAERCAFLLGDNLSERITIKKFIKYVYKLRSSYVHHGKSNINYKLINKFNNYVKNAILTSIIIINKGKIYDEESFRKWFEIKNLLNYCTKQSFTLRPAP